MLEASVLQLQGSHRPQGVTSTECHRSRASVCSYGTVSIECQHQALSKVFGPQTRWDTLKVGGRLTDFHLSLDLKHPILLPFRQQVVRLLLQHTKQGKPPHECLAQLFWTVCGGAAVKRVIKKFVRCRRRMDTRGYNLWPRCRNTV